MDRDKIKNVLNMLNHMCFEVNLYIGKNVLAKGYDGKYANRYEVRPMEVRFYLYNSETQTTACKVYAYEKFCEICSDQYKMMAEFSKATEQLMDRTSEKSKEILYIKEGLII